MFKIYDEPESPMRGLVGLFRIYDEPESPKGRVSDTQMPLALP